MYTSTNNYLGWGTGGTGVLGVGTGDRGLIHGDVLQWTNNNPLGWALGWTGVLGVGTGDRGLRLGQVLQRTNNPLGCELGGWGFRGGDRGEGTYTWRCSTMNKQQPFRLGTGVDWGFRGGDRGQGT